LYSILEDFSNFIKPRRKKMSEEKAELQEDLGGGWSWDPAARKIFRPDGKYFAVVMDTSMGYP
jgi:hypothetical protein